jgi:hypothetical protein
LVCNNLESSCVRSGCRHAWTPRHNFTVSFRADQLAGDRPGLIGGQEHRDERDLRGFHHAADGIAARPHSMHCDRKRPGEKLLSSPPVRGQYRRRRYRGPWPQRARRQWPRRWARASRCRPLGHRSSPAQCRAPAPAGCSANRRSGRQARRSMRAAPRARGCVPAIESTGRAALRRRLAIAPVACRQPI